jgi:hypothetical protein
MGGPGAQPVPVALPATLYRVASPCLRPLAPPAKLGRFSSAASCCLLTPTGLGLGAPLQGSLFETTTKTFVLQGTDFVNDKSSSNQPAPHSLSHSKGRCCCMGLRSPHVLSLALRSYTDMQARKRALHVTAATFTIPAALHARPGGSPTSFLPRA